MNISDSLSKIFSVLSNPIRLKIYLLILDGVCDLDPNCATSISEKLGLNQPTVSNHIKELVGANLVIIRKIGKHSYLYGVSETSNLIFNFGSEVNLKVNSIHE